SQSISGIFFMMLDHPVEWNKEVDKESTLEYVFSNQKITLVNEAMANQFRASKEELMGITPSDFFPHDVKEGKKIWRELFDKGRVRIQTKKPRFDGSLMVLEGDYICLYDDEGRIKGHFGIQKDVTERHDYERLLKKSKEKYKQFYQNAPVAYQSLDQEGRILEVNKLWTDETGYAREEALGKCFFDLLEEPSIDIARKNFERLVREGKSTKTEVVLRKKDNSLIIIEIQGRVTLDDNGKFVNSNCIFKNITDKRKAERSLRENQQQLQAIFDNAIIGIGYTDLNGNTLKVNRAFCNLIGYSEREIMGKGFSEFTHPADREMEMDIIKDLIDRKERHTQFEKRYITKEGKTIWVSIAVSVIYDDQKNVLNLVGTVRDETLRKESDRKEERRRELENLRTEIWKSASLIHEEDELIANLLKKAGPVLGVENLSFMPYDENKDEVFVKLIWRADGTQSGKGERIPKRIFKAYFGKPYIYLSFDKVPALLKPVLIPLRKKYNTWSTLVIPYGDPEEPEGFLSSQTYNFPKEYSEEEILVFQEISKIIFMKSRQIRSEKALRENEKRLGELNSMKDRLFSIIAHDLKNPINAIGGFSELIKSRAADIDHETLIKYNSMILQSSREATVLLNNLLDWARVQTGKILYDPRKIKLSEIYNSVVGLLRLSMEEKNIHIEAHFDKGLVVFADVKMLSIILRNLISNAIKFSYKGEGIFFHAEKKDEGVIISVIDKGIGIPGKDLPLIFDRSKNTTRKGTVSERGTGLGLILCQEFANRHGTRIEVESEEGKGSRFWLVLLEG
ncbi:MAG: PAS domain S-box protein, partial [Bacteroidota bacterium]